MTYLAYAAHLACMADVYLMAGVAGVSYSTRRAWLAFHA